MAIDAVPAPQTLLDELHVEFFGDPRQLQKLLAEADYVSLHVPLNSKTRHMIDRGALLAMKPTARLINVARGGIVDETALIEALKSGRIKGAGIDTFSQEPPDPAHPLLHMENVVATPHIAGGTRETVRRRTKAAAENVFRVAEGLPPICQITSAE